MTEYVAALDVCITQTKLPMRVRAFCKKIGDDKCIVLNEDLDDEKKYEVVAHELLHLANNDLSSEENVETLEKRAGNRA